MKNFKSLFRKILCKVGLHHYTISPIMSNLDSYWLQGGQECDSCHTQKISFNESARLVTFAYNRGKQDSSTEFLAYGRGVQKVVALYGNEYVQTLINRDRK